MTEQESKLQSELETATAVIGELQAQLASVEKIGPGVRRMQIDGVTYEVTAPKFNLSGQVVVAAELTEAQARALLAMGSGILKRIE